jgi:hypothetical protein
MAINLTCRFPGAKIEPFMRARFGLPLLLGALSFVAYLPAFNNGFISDDYVILQRVEILKNHPFYLFEIPPEGFRTSSYIAFALLKMLFGYRPEFFYLFAILLHWANACLLFRLLSSVTLKPSAAALTAVLFAVFQNPQEATMWLTGMHESLLGISVLTALILWRKGRYFLSTLLYLLALLTKESAVLLLALVPLVDFWAEKELRFRRQYLYLLVPTAVFAVLFLSTFHSNSFVGNGLYGLGPRALIVLALSLHRLSFPWLYLAVVLVLFSRKKRLDINFTAALTWMVLTLMPYMFLLYMNHVPSRQVHLASMGLTAGLAFLLKDLDVPALRKVFLVCFIAWNTGYLWMVKDGQYERRAAPSSRLIEELKRRPPGPLIVEGYPENPWIAKETTWLVPGWRPEMIKADPADSAPPNSPRLRWDPETATYQAL